MKLNEGTVTVERAGRTYSGTWRVERGLITVTTAHGQKTTQLGDSPAEVLARIMLGELVNDQKA
jgi:hypothetical protein